LTADQSTPSRLTYLGLFFVALATLTHQVLLTRIFSVTMWYHFAFVAISIAMFGMTAGALLVYVFRPWFTAGRLKVHLAWTALAYAVLIVLSFLTSSACRSSFIRRSWPLTRWPSPSWSSACRS
jgi:hypothetical protein